MSTSGWQFEVLDLTQSMFLRDGKAKNGINFRGAEKAEANRKRDELYVSRLWACVHPTIFSSDLVHHTQATNPAINLMLSHNAISRFEVSWRY